MPKNIGLVNVAYSPNLGDGVIAECLSAILRQRFGSEAHNIDIAGRDDFGTAPRRSLMLRTLAVLPPAGRRAAVRLALTAKHMRLDEPLTHPVDLLLVGGGQLLQDDDLNFPLKLRRVLAQAARRRLPVAIVSAGVAGSWSKPGLQIVRQALSECDVIGVGLRDPGSLSNWGRLFADMDLPKAQLCPDPVIGIASLMPEYRRETPRGSMNVGVNVTNPMILARHAHGPMASTGDALAAWTRLIKALEQRGHAPVLFTNGSPEDEEFLGAVVTANGPRSRSRRLPKAKHPLDLVRTIAGLDLLFAYRLHAAIVGVSFDVPVIGFKWDDKLAAFFDYAGLGEFAMDLHKAPVESILAASDRARDPRYDAVRAKTRETSGDLLMGFLTRVIGRRAPELAPERTRHAE